MDCYQLLAEFYKDMYGLEFLGYKYKLKDLSRREMIEMFRAGIERDEFRKVNKPEFGDIIVINLAGQPLHVAIYIGDNVMLHAIKNCDSCLERIGIKWKNRIEGFYRWQSFKHIHSKKIK